MFIENRISDLETAIDDLDRVTSNLESKIVSINEINSEILATYARMITRLDVLKPENFKKSLEEIRSESVQELRRILDSEIKGRKSLEMTMTTLFDSLSRRISALEKSQEKDVKPKAKPRVATKTKTPAAKKPAATGRRKTN